jgi:hypothetical protein
VVDGNDHGIVSPSETKKIVIPFGQHVVKCTIESIPDLVWRKAIDVRTSEQVVAVVALKALHSQYDDARQQAVEDKHQEAAAEQQRHEAADAAEKQKKLDEEQFPERFFLGVKGTWRETFRGSDNIPQHYILVLQSNDAGVISATFTWRIDSPYCPKSTGNLYRFKLRPTRPNVLITESAVLADSSDCKGRSSGRPPMDLGKAGVMTITVADKDHLRLAGWEPNGTHILTRD